MNSRTHFKSAFQENVLFLRAVFLLGLALIMPFAAEAQVNYATPYTFGTWLGQIGVRGTNNGTGTNAQFNTPNSLAMDRAGNIYLADLYNERVRMITPSGLVTTVAGGNYGYTNGSNTSAAFASPVAVVVDGATNLYVADIFNCAIRKIVRSGTNWVVSTLAGGHSGYSDGTGTSASFYCPIGLAIDNATNLYVADQDPFGRQIRRVTPAGVVTTLMTSGSGYRDGSNSTAEFYLPTGIAIDSASNLYVADNGNAVIRKLTPSGSNFVNGTSPGSSGYYVQNYIVTTIAGSPQHTGTNDGVGTNAQFNQPNTIAIDNATNLYVADQGNDTVRLVSPVGTNWVVTTLAGQPGVTGANDGTGSTALFDYPSDVLLDKYGDLFVADLYNETIRRGFLAGGRPAIVTNTTSAVWINGQFGFTLTAAPRQPVLIDASPDLMNWFPIATNTVGPGFLPFTDSQSTTTNNRFYRVQLP